jgi:hypothetical protein
MFQIVLGWKSHSTQAVPELIFLGTDGNKRVEAVKDMAGKGYVRAQLFVNPIGTPVQIAETPEEIAARTEKAAAEAAASAEAERVRKIKEAEAQFQAAHDALHALKSPAPAEAGTPTPEEEKPKGSKKPKQK